MSDDPTGRNHDLLEALCWLAIAPQGRIPLGNLPDRFAPFLKALVSLGAVTPGEPLSVITCCACDDDHMAEVEFEPKTHRRFHFCPEAGRVYVDARTLATLRFEPEWLLAWMGGQLPPAQGRGRVEIVPSTAWHLGEFILDATSVSLNLLIGNPDAEIIGIVAEALRHRPRTDLTVVVTAGPPSWAPPQSATRFYVLELRDIASADSKALTLDIIRLKRWVRSWSASAKRPSRNESGRPSQVGRTIEIYRVLRKPGAATSGRMTMARAVRAEWRLRFPNDEIPSERSIRRHIQQFEDGLADDS